MDAIQNYLDATILSLEMVYQNGLNGRQYLLVYNHLAEFPGIAYANKQISKIQT